MRFVFDIDNKASVSCSGSSYTRPIDHKPSRDDAYKASVHILSICPFTKKESVIEIEGSSEHIMQAAKDIISQLEAMKGVIWEQAEWAGIVKRESGV